MQQQEREFRDELAELEREREILRQQTKQMAFDGARLQLIEERYDWLKSLECATCSREGSALTLCRPYGDRSIDRS